MGDIKVIWELSRMAWVPALARAARGGNVSALATLNGWLDRWLAQNEPYFGANWKCGQEASVRVMQLAQAALLLGQAESTEAGLTDLIAMHAERIEPTIGYAIGQDNNHGTSEAAALFIAGTMPSLAGHDQASKWREKGRFWLENRVARLVDSQGTFSLYSTNYHRVLLDTLSLSELWRRRFEQPAFSNRFQERARAAVEWLRAQVDVGTGDVPNVGNNDGARILDLGCAEYRDYRPSVQLASILFLGRPAFPLGPWNDGLTAFGVVPQGPAAPPPGDYMALAGGFAILRRGQASALIRVPSYSFRPAQADALHVDLTVAGLNVLRDGGSFSYMAEPDLVDYFSGVRSHNTVAFDYHDQMPRLGRFLFCDWNRIGGLNFDIIGPVARFAASYRDAWGARHERRVQLSNQALVVEDCISGFADKAILRWRLAPRDWHLDGRSVKSGRFALAVLSEVEAVRFEVVAGLESRHYFEKTPLPVLEVEFDRPAEIQTRVTW
ncbi:heparinase II/III domain-containing protein [Croceibacterium aestuarii]|uniref:heparinase II/III domain-containing protein n=1 Tax=Croceibacterium aestuarii TaxID=3064139 RepID=UPI00272EC150|nr:heparinase II/III family protein [Croceibacterium sp. D39]